MAALALRRADGEVAAGQFRDHDPVRALPQDELAFEELARLGLPPGSAVVTLTVPWVASITDPEGDCSSVDSGTNLLVPGSLTSTVPDTGATLPECASTGGGDDGGMIIEESTA